jgi:hypothetical protein
VSILIRLRRLLEGESRVPPPLEAARASIVLLSFGTRAGRMRVRRVRFRVLANGARARPGRRRTTESFFKGTNVDVPFNLGRRVGFNCDLRFFHTEVACEIAPESG